MGMGSLLVYQPRERHTHRVKKMLKFALSTFVIVGLATGYPQGYGGVQPAPSRQVSSSSIQCRTEYATTYDTTYQETETQECVTKYDNVCKTTFERQCQPTTRQECNTVYEKQCKTIYKNVCVDKYRTEYEPYTETECSTEYKEDCEYQWEGHGNDKVWAPIAGTCKSNPYETCSDVTKSKAVQVPYPVCRDIPEQKCVDVPRQDCVRVPDQVCTNQPLQKCQDVPRQECQQIHKKVPNRVSRKVPKKVCQDSGSHLDGVAVGSGPVVIDARKNEKSVQLEGGFETPNSIVFGD